MTRNYKRFANEEAMEKFQTELRNAIRHCAFDCEDAYYADALCAIRNAYNLSLQEEIGGQMVISHGAFLVVRNALSTLSNEAICDDEDPISEQILGLVDLLDKAVGDDD